MAQLLQANILVLLVGASAWLTGYWARSALLAVAGAVAIGMAYSLVLALELFALRTIGSRDPAPRPAWGDLLQAWAKETIFACWRWKASVVPDGIPRFCRMRRLNRRMSSTLATS